MVGIVAVFARLEELEVAVRHAGHAAVGGNDESQYQPADNRLNKYTHFPGTRQKLAATESTEDSSGDTHLEVVLGIQTAPTVQHVPSRSAMNCNA